VEQIEVDGSLGEGGGQILRTAVAFSAIRRAPLRVVKIRGGRQVPGLRPQHVSALKVLASVFGGSLEGAEEGSTTVTFVPDRPRLRSISVDMGTAASITLVLQAVIPAVALSGSELALSLTGGTDVPWSPTFDYFRGVVIPGYRSIGIEAEAKALRRGYYPKGGGVATVNVRRSASLKPLDLTSRRGVTGAVLASRCGMLPKRVAERQALAAADRLAVAGVRVDREEVTEEKSSSPGTSVSICSVGEGFIIGSDSIGARGKPAEEVGLEAAEKFLSVVESGACMDANVADMLLPLLALAPLPSRVMVPRITSHLESGLRLAEQFTSCKWLAEQVGNGVVVSVVPRVPGDSRWHNV
jgi:RNA 3'-phosphate cyclase